MSRTKTEDVLLSLGIPVGIKGFTYITDAIEVFESKGTEISTTKELYPLVAKMNETTDCLVERAMRYAFAAARKCSENYEKVNHYISFSSCDNTNSLKRLYLMMKREEA